MLAGQIHPIRVGEGLIRHPLHRRRHVVDPGLGRIPAAVEARRPLPGVAVEVLVAAVTCDEHDGRRDLLGVGDEPGSRHPIADAGGTRLSSDVMVEVGHDSTGAFLDHRLQGIADIVADVSLDGLLRRRWGVVDDLA